jgi:hypothetical protein
MKKIQIEDTIFYHVLQRCISNKGCEFCIGNEKCSRMKLRLCDYIQEYVTSIEKIDIYNSKFYKTIEHCYNGEKDKCGNCPMENECWKEENDYSMDSIMEELSITEFFDKNDFNYMETIPISIIKLQQAILNLDRIPIRDVNKEIKDLITLSNIHACGCECQFNCHLCHSENMCISTENENIAKVCTRIDNKKNIPPCQYCKKITDKYIF